MCVQNSNLSSNVGTDFVEDLQYNKLLHEYKHNRGKPKKQKKTKNTGIKTIQMNGEGDDKY